MVESHKSYKAYNTLPILVGVSGKRSFASDNELHLTYLDRFKDRFRALIAELDEELPHTPKVLVSGGAAGTDLAAIATVLERRDGVPSHSSWSVVVMLPFEMELFSEDFDGLLFQDDFRYLQSLHDDARVVFKHLRPLKTTAAHGKFSSAQILSRDSQHFDRQERSRHYEQLGLWLAHNVTLLVAALPPETARFKKPEDIEGAQLGGTARVVAYRRAAVPDEEAREVLKRSVEMEEPSPLLELDGGYVFWLNPLLKGHVRSGRSGAHILRPVQHMFDVRHKSRAWEDRATDIYDAPLRDRMLHLRDRRERWNRALALAVHLERMHARSRMRAVPALPAVAGNEHPAIFLEEIRSHELRRQQSDSASWVRRIQRVSALLFLLSVSSYEVYTELWQYNPIAISVYLVILAATWGLAMWLDRSGIQLRAEDYRGVSEMLRVQIAWWSAGVSKMTDSKHLRTVDSNLLLVREAAKTISLWALLRCRELATLDVAAIPDTPMVDRTRKWVSLQADYFRKNSKLQSQSRRISELSSRMTFIAALVGLLALVFLGWWYERAETALRWIQVRVDLPFAAMSLAMAGLILWFLTNKVLGGKPQSPRHGMPALSWISCHRSGFFSGVSLLMAALILAAGAGLTPIPYLSFIWAIPQGSRLYLFCLLLFVVLLARIPWRASAWDVRHHGAWLARFAGTLLGALSLLAAAVFARGNGNVAEVFRGWVLAQSVLLLGAAGAIRWYTTRRNHSAQAVHYDDMLRAFRRIEDWLEKRPGAYDEEALKNIVALGELALDESEAWLKAHRDLPPEAPVS